MRHLAGRVHAGVGASGDGQRDRRHPQHGGQRLLHDVLHGAAPGLGCPAGEVGSVIGKVEADPHVRIRLDHVLLWCLLRLVVGRLLGQLAARLGCLGAGLVGRFGRSLGIALGEPERGQAALVLAALERGLVGSGLGGLLVRGLLVVGCSSADPATAAAVADSDEASSAISRVRPVGAFLAAVRVPRARSASETIEVSSSTSSMIAIGALSPLRGLVFTMRV